MTPIRLLTCVLIACGMFARVASADAPDFAEDIAPIFAKYCTGCHNGEDLEGELSLESFAELEAGGQEGPLLVARDAAASRLLRVLSGDEEPQMPPEGSEGPSAEEIERIKAWIVAGAQGPDGAAPIRRQLQTPQVEPQADLPPAITALAVSPSGGKLALARFARVDLLASVLQEVDASIADLPGKVTALAFSPDGAKLAVATGIGGLYADVHIYDAQTRSLIETLQAHRDAIYTVCWSHDAKTLASAGYDRRILLWDVTTAQPRLEITGHNGAVFDLAFSPDDRVLASASADETVKLWSVTTGERLDTLSQPTAEQYTVAFRPDGKHVVAGGADNRIRVWQFVSRDRPQINPLLYARFAHEGAINQLEFSPDGQLLVSAAEDRTLRVCETVRYADSRSLGEQSDVASGLAVSPSGRKLVVARMDGTWQVAALEPVEQRVKLASREPQRANAPPTHNDAPASSAVEHLAEAEPNDAPDAAQAIELPVTIEGVIADDQDVDFYRFRSSAGRAWWLETRAERIESPLDSKIEVLDERGEPIPRVKLQAVRDSYFTFRGKPSDIADDYRLHNWREMELNEYLYANGEVVKLWLYPRGPDSGFMVYPGQGKRFTYFDTTALSHPLGAPCYIVEPHPPEATVIPNGLPVFTVNYENDDDSRREAGKDSRLLFTAPSDGDYLVRVSDVRGFGDDDHKYELIVRRPNPDFDIKLGVEDHQIPRGGGREISVKVTRKDRFEGPIRVDMIGELPGFDFSFPITIEAGQIEAMGTVNAAADAPEPDAEALAALEFRATAQIDGREVAHEVQGFDKLALVDNPPVIVSVHPNTGDAESENRSAGEPLELVIAPGETIRAIVRVERNDYDGHIAFGSATCGRNLPHGVYVDNIGLNGLAITTGNDEREFFITAAKWVPETSRLFHLRAEVEGFHTSRPVMLHVRPSTRVAER